MTTYPFTGDELRAINFTPTLDGAVYSADITWNVAGQRWYITITGSNGVRYMTKPLIGSVTTMPINLLYGIFTTSTMVWIESDGLIVVVP